MIDTCVIAQKKRFVTLLSKINSFSVKVIFVPVMSRFFKFIGSYWTTPDPLTKNFNVNKITSNEFI